LLVLNQRDFLIAQAIGLIHQLFDLLVGRGIMAFGKIPL